MSKKLQPCNFFQSPTASGRGVRSQLDFPPVHLVPDLVKNLTFINI